MGGAGLGRRALLGHGLGAALLLPGCAGADPRAAAELDAAALAEQRRRPELYTDGEARAFRVTRGGAERGLLWGTWHIGYGDSTVLPRAVRGRFNAARLLLVEQVFNPASPAFRNGIVRLLRRSLMQADPAALARLGGATRAELLEAGLSEEELRSRSLLGLSGLVSARAAVEAPGVLPSGGIVDVNLMGFARSIGVPVEGLEELSAAQVRALSPADPNGRDAEDMLRLALRRRDGMGGMRTWLQGQYGQGRIGPMLAVMTGWRAAPADLRRADQARAPMLSQRNLAWMPKLEAALAPAAGEARPVFTAVGAGHLMGTDGLVALLRGRGWAVEACVGDRLPEA